MNRIGNVWPEIVRLENLLLAWLRARSGKLDRPAVAGFGVQLENELLDLQRTLKDGSYAPGAYRAFRIYDRKPRRIHAAPFRDRVVQHALMAIIEPPLDRRFIHDTYACRAGKGVHRAVDRYQQHARRYAYVLKLDVAQYFNSIEQATLLYQLSRRIKDRHALALMREIISNAPGSRVNERGNRCGIPIGNLTSQFFANLYLDDFDHWVFQSAGISAYIRYVDDLFIFSDNKKKLWQMYERSVLELAGIGLAFKPAATALSRTSEKVNVLGYQVSRQRRWLKNDNGHRFRRRFHALARAVNTGRVAADVVRPSLCAWIGHAQHGETIGLRESIIPRVVFSGNVANSSE